MKKIIILGSFSTIMFSCAKHEAVKNEIPLSIGATDFLTSPSTVRSTPLSQGASSVPQRQAKKDNQIISATEWQGKWINESDSLAYLDISGSSWISGYEGEEVTQDNRYTYTLVDKLPQFVDPNVRAEFIVLANKNDTMYYEINGLTKETLSLTLYPEMKLQLYKRVI